MEYDVKWKINVEADNDLEAGMEAKRMIQNQETTATFFEVKPTGSRKKYKTVDTSEHTCLKCGSENTLCDDGISMYDDVFGVKKISCGDCKAEWESFYEKMVICTGTKLLKKN